MRCLRDAVTLQLSSGLASVDTRGHNRRYNVLHRHCKIREDTSMRPFRLISHADVRQARMLAATAEPTGKVHAGQR